ncbi:MAG: DNA polymerase III subunit delta' [Deltaproteobacteria bacterium]|nr:DNA polymerase III subunit delta' [Deltaproteobacteria bacterium]MBW2658683.1 DNA polymerase III subunit delta' [Deltaproteobacteria bacterium]
MAEKTPLCFTRLLGHERAGEMLKRSLVTDRIPHSFIFKGPEGVGRKLFGRGFAAAINCRDSSTIGACGICSSCLKFYSGNHPDFMVVSSEKGGIRINQVRNLSRNLSYPPYESAMRVVILEDVHTMRQEAANSLLKTLEEPPENNLLILTADASREILATLTSRCQVVPFCRLSNDDTARILKGHGVSSAEALLLAHLSEGSPGRALLLKETDIVELWKDIVAVLSSGQSGADADIGVLIKLAAKMAELQENLEHLLGLLKVWFRDLLVAARVPACSKETILQFSGVDLELSPLKSWSSGQLFAKVQAIDSAQRALARNCNKLLVCEVLLFKLQ